MPSGCVLLTTHTQVVKERDAARGRARQLEERGRVLETSRESLSVERSQLIDEMEDLRIARQELERNVAALRDERDMLESSLEAREQELEIRTSELERVGTSYEGLVAELQEEVAAGRVTIERLTEGLNLRLDEAIVFRSGSATLVQGGEAVVARVAKRLRGLPDRIEVRGHTDGQALRPGGRFSSNWELAAARAAKVVRLLQAGGIAGERLRVISYGEYLPVADNETREGRAANRRIEIRLRHVLAPRSVPEAAGSE